MTKGPTAIRSSTKPEAKPAFLPAPPSRFPRAHRAGQRRPGPRRRPHPHEMERQASSIAAWNHDQTLASAMRHSVVWYFQRVATGIGEERMQRELDRIGYGNRDISGGLTRFWLQSSLKISPREQVGLLRALFNGSLPSPPRTSPSSSGTSRCPPGTACASWARQAQARTTPTGASSAGLSAAWKPAQPLVIRREHPRAGRLRRAGRGIAEAALKRLSILP